MSPVKQRAGAPERGFAGGYSARDAAKLLDIPPAQIRAWVRAGFLSPRRGARNEYRFTFQDLVVLRTAKALLEQLPARKVKRSLARLRQQLPRGRELANVRITAEGDHIVVRDGGVAWVPESGQALLDFDVAALATEVAPLVRQAAHAAREADGALSAEGWYELACDLEAVEPRQARDAYRRALELDPEHYDARINLGRLLHEAGELDAAEAHYRLAIQSRPEDATAAFNLGVALEDQRRPLEAVRAYEQSIAADPDLADAHYNLACLYERLGRPKLAIRHLQIYRGLSVGA
jgi:tetratricopeptide (TPR) repeat protein